MYGLLTPSASFFVNTTTLRKISPSRARTRLGTIPDSRPLNPHVSFEERMVVKVSTKFLRWASHVVLLPSIIVTQVRCLHVHPREACFRYFDVTASLSSLQEHFFVAVYYQTLMDSISAPLNMPPRYTDFARGRVLLGFNTSSQDTTTPWLRDSKDDVAISADYWDNPTASDELAKELKDTFHEV